MKQQSVKTRMKAVARIGDAVLRVSRQAWTRLKARARLRRQHRAKLRNQRLKYVSAEQLVYADLLEAGVAVGRIFLAFTFFLYVSGIVAPKVAFSDLPAYWSLSASDYLQSVGVGIGWNWFAQVDNSDYTNFIGIAFLIGLTIFCYLRLLQFAWKYRDSVFGAVVALELIVLVFAASGLLASSH